MEEQNIAAEFGTNERRWHATKRAAREFMGAELAARAPADVTAVESFDERPFEGEGPATVSVS